MPAMIYVGPQPVSVHFHTGRSVEFDPGRPVVLDHDEAGALDGREHFEWASEPSDS